MKHLIKYKLFENTNPSNSDELCDLIRSELDEVDVNQFNIYLSSCFYKARKGTSKPTKSRPSYNSNPELLNTFDQKITVGEDRSVTTGPAGQRYTLPYLENNKIGLVLRCIISNDSFGTRNSENLDINKIFNSLYRGRFLSYGFDYILTSGPGNSDVILFYKTTPFTNESSYYIDDDRPTDFEIAESAKQDLDDILIYLKDEGLKTEVIISMDYHADLFVNIMDYDNKPVQWKTIKDDVERGIEVVGDRFRPSTVYYKVLSENGKILNRDRDTATWENFLKMRFNDRGWPITLRSDKKEDIEDYLTNYSLIDDMYLAFLAIELNQIV